MAKMTKRALAALTEDAKNRSWRTALQGLAIDVGVAIVIVLAPALAGAEAWGDFKWAILGFSVFKSAAQAVLSFVMRRWLDPSGLPTPLPPKPQPEPAE